MKHESKKRRRRQGWIRERIVCLLKALAPPTAQGDIRALSLRERINRKGLFCRVFASQPVTWFAVWFAGLVLHCLPVDPQRQAAGG